MIDFFIFLFFLFFFPQKHKTAKQEKVLKELEKRLGYEKEKGEKVIEGLKAADVENKALQKVSMEFYSQTNTSMDKRPILSASELNRIYNLLLEAWRRGRASDL